MKKAIALLICIILLAALWTGCTPRDSAQLLPSKETGETEGTKGKKSYDIIGTVESVTEARNGDILGTIRVKATDPNSLYDYASLTITQDTLLLKDSGEASFSDLQEGTAVEIILTDGPVAESYPVQAGAKTVVIKE